MSGSTDDGRTSGEPVGVRRVRGVAELTSLDEVRAAAKDWMHFSSRVQGDPDVRDYPQLPLEVDPPEHGRYRALLDPILGRRAVAALEPALRTIAGGLVTDAARRGRMEAVHDLAVPMVARSIAHAFGRPGDADELASWGITSWEVGLAGERSGARLDAYVNRVLDEGASATTSGGAGGGAFSQIARARIDGRALTRREQVGLANLILAGGRDTVILLLCGAMWHLAGDHEAQARVRSDPSRLHLAIEEYLRYLSPNPGMERLVTADVAGEWGSARAGDVVVLGWGAANHDPTAIEDPGEVRPDRRPNPHVAFGSGPHTCIGIHLARLEARLLLEELLAAVPHWRLADGMQAEWIQHGDDLVPSRFDRLPLRLGQGPHLVTA